jgi:hypothetical protein
MCVAGTRGETNLAVKPNSLGRCNHNPPRAARCQNGAGHLKLIDPLFLPGSNRRVEAISQADRATLIRR